MLIPTSFGPEESEFVALTHLAKNANMKQSQYMHLTNQMEVSCCHQLGSRITKDLIYLIESVTRLYNQTVAQLYNQIRYTISVFIGQKSDTQHEQTDQA